MRVIKEIYFQNIREMLQSIWHVKYSIEMESFRKENCELHENERNNENEI